MNGKASLSTVCTAILSVGFLASTAAGAAQEYTYDSAYIRVADGNVRVQRAQNPEPEPGEANLPVLSGDRMWTTASSFAELRLADGAIVRLGESTKVDFIAFGSEPNILLWNGSVVVKAGVESAGLRIDTPSGSVSQQTAGTYRVDVVDGVTTTVTVADGVAELGSEQSSVLVYAGQRSSVEPDGAPLEPFPFDVTVLDGLDVWSRAHDREEPRRRTVELIDLPPEVHHYVDDLSDHGTWGEEQSYGAVWYPTSVGVGWAPYRNGRWSHTSYGYTWVSHEPWGWAPSHYGRWGYGHSGWFWVPGRHWSPAWVSIAVGPTWIGWSPLGHHGGAVFAYNHSFYGSGRYPSYRGRPYYRGGKAVPRHVYDHGAGWNYSRKDHFARRGKARLRAGDVRSTSGRARVHGGAVLDRTMTPQTTRTNNERAAGRRVWSGASSGRRLRAAAGRTSGRSAVSSGAIDRQVQRSSSQPATRAGRGEQVDARGQRNGSRVFRAPSTARGVGSRGRSLGNSSSTTSARQPTQPRTRTRSRTPTRTRGQEFFEGSSRRPAERRATTRSRGSTTARGGITTSRGRTRSQGNAVGGAGTRGGNRPSTGARAPQSQRRSSGRVSTPRGSSRSSGRVSTPRGSSRSSGRVSTPRGSSRSSGGGRVGSGSRGSGSRSSGTRGGRGSGGGRGRN